jgi:hypothetical protein
VIKLDIVILIFLGILQVVSAAWGGIVSAKSLQDSPKTKKFHIVAFSIMALLGVLLVAAQGFRTYYQQRDAKAEHDRDQEALKKLQESEDATKHSLDIARDELHQSVLSQEFMKGQLSMVAVSINNSGVSVAQAIRDMASKPSAEQITTARLCERTKTLASAMIETESKNRQEQSALSNAARGEMAKAGWQTQEAQQLWNKNMEDEMTLRARQDAYAYDQFFAEAKFLEEELLLRSHRPNMKEPIFLKSHMIAGSNPLSEAAGYLGAIANQLCESGTPKQQK